MIGILNGIRVGGLTHKKNWNKLILYHISEEQLLPEMFKMWTAKVKYKAFRRLTEEQLIPEKYRQWKLTIKDPNCTNKDCKKTSEQLIPDKYIQRIWKLSKTAECAAKESQEQFLESSKMWTWKPKPAKNTCACNIKNRKLQHSVNEQLIPESYKQEVWKIHDCNGDVSQSEQNGDLTLYRWVIKK